MDIAVTVIERETNWSKKHGISPGSINSIGIPASFILNKVSAKKFYF